MTTMADRNVLGWMYFVGPDRDECPIKIGFTTRAPKRRMLDLQPGCWMELKLFGAVPAYYSEEQDLHAQLADVRVMGEWFDRDSALLMLASLEELDEAEREYIALMGDEA